MKTKIDVAIVGAGPYGLSAAAHLRTVPGLEIRVFGEPMSFWSHNMPCGMLLRSNWTATRIADPHRELTLEAFQAESGEQFSLPVPLSSFIRYGLWYQSHAVGELERCKVVRVELCSSGFCVYLMSGESFQARRVVVAAGIEAFAWRPPEFASLPSYVASHASQTIDLERFRGKKVLVVGSGQSALESGALLHELGAEPEIVGRATHLNWLQGWLSKTLHHRLGKSIRSLLYAPTDVGPAGLSQLLARPELLRMLPRSFQDRLRKRAVRPAGARWLLNRLRQVPILLGTQVISAVAEGEGVKVRLSNGTERKVDHILLGTGYRVDISKYDFLSAKILNSIDRVNGFPRLLPGLETSVSGLHFLGAPAAWSFGPLMQFVSGTTYASSELTRRIGGTTCERSQVDDLPLSNNG